MDKLIFDPNLPGFGIRKTGNRKVYIIYTSHAKKRVYKTLGTVDQLSLPEARKKALYFINNFKTSENLTLKELCDLWYSRIGKLHKTNKTTLTRINRAISFFGDVFISEIKTDDFQRLHLEITKTAPIEANRVIKLFKAIFNKAINWELCEKNPAKAVTLNKEKIRKRWITDAELKSLITSVEKRKSIYAKTAIKLLFLTGCRVNEILTLKWEHIKDDKILILDPKNDNDHFVFLTDYAQQLIKELPKGISEYLFPQSCQKKPMTSLKSTFARIKRDAKINNITIHDIRKLCASWLGEDGYTNRQVGSQLNQKTPQITWDYTLLRPKKSMAYVLEKKLLHYL